MIKPKNITMQNFMRTFELKVDNMKPTDFKPTDTLQRPTQGQELKILCPKTTAAKIAYTTCPNTSWEHF